MKPRRTSGLLEYRDYDAPIRDTADYLVIGSGPGGALLAKELSGSGKKVVVVEAGPYLRPRDMVPDVGKTFASFFWEGGTRTTRGNVMMPTLQARVLGGGSVFNSAICMRPLPSVLARWREDHGLHELTDEALAPHLDAVADFLGVRATDSSVLGRRNELFLEACDHLGWNGQAMTRMEEGCTGSGQCITGCRAGAKNSMDRRGIPQVIDNGGTVYCSVHADTLILENGRVRGLQGWTIDPVSHERGHGVRIHAGCTIVCAGAVHTPVILRRSGLKRDAIGQNVRLHPSCYVVGVMDDAVNPWEGATQGVHCPDFLERGIKLESLWASSSTFAMRFPKGAKQFKRYLKRYPRMAIWDGWVSGDASTGTVRSLPGGRADVQFELADPDVRRLQEANAMLCEMYAAVGAKEVLTGIHGLPEVLDPAEAARELRTQRLDAKDMVTGSNHVMGTTRMGNDPDEGAVCDGWGKVYDADDLYVCDTGLYPTSPGVNPQMTVMALARRLGQELPTRY